MMFSGLTVLIVICAFLIPEGIVLGGRRFLHSIYEAMLRENEFILYENKIYKSFKMFGHPYVIFPITMSVSFFMYVFQF